MNLEKNLNKTFRYFSIAQVNFGINISNGDNELNSVKNEVKTLEEQMNIKPTAYNHELMQLKEHLEEITSNLHNEISGIIITQKKEAQEILMKN